MEGPSPSLPKGGGAGVVEKNIDITYLIIEYIGKGRTLFVATTPYPSSPEEGTTKRLHSLFRHTPTSRMPRLMLFPPSRKAMGTRTLFENEMGSG